MPLLGAHMSIAGGLHKAVEAAAALGMETVQIFTHSPSQWAVKPVTPAAKELHRDGKSLTKNNNQWRAKSLSEEDIRRFKESLAQHGICHPISHDSYLINLASPDRVLWKRSIDAFVVELVRAEQLGIPYVVTHPGAFVDSTEAAGLKRVVRGLDEAFRQTRGFEVGCLLETTAGQGTSLGWRFEQIATILGRVKAPERVGVCFDTCHVFAAGYPLATAREYKATWAAFDSIIGISTLRAFHLNDSQKPLGSRVDRHARIGHGQLGLEPFRRLMNDRRFRHIPMYLETPKGTVDGEDLDVVNLRALRSLVGKG
jgi:deoxyribonuclease-4